MHGNFQYEKIVLILILSIVFGGLCVIFCLFKWFFRIYAIIVQRRSNKLLI